MLGHYRVLDLTDHRGLIAGMVLADLGADVIAIEPPEGNSGRRRGPFANDIDDGEHSLNWWSYARHKRSMTADLGTDEGRERVRQLAATSDVLIESSGPGVLDAIGLGYQQLDAVNPALVYASISGFGHDGPKAGYAESDLAVVASSGQMVIIGDHDRAPMRIGVPQSGLHAGTEAAQAVLIALRERKRSGRGQHLDISAQASTMQATQSLVLAAAVGDVDTVRFTGGVNLSGLPIPLVWRAQDGFASVTFLFGAAIGPFSRRLMEWIHEEGGCDEATRDKDWLNYTTLLGSGEESPEEYARVLQVVGAFVATKTKQELLEQAMVRRLLIVPMSSIADLHDSPQFAARQYWNDISANEASEETGSTRYPGAFARMSGTPLDLGATAPTLGQHDADYEATLSRVPDSARQNAGGGGDLPLSDLKVLDFMWVVAGPASTRVMSDYGAQVVKIESTTRVDTARGLGPWNTGEAGPENSALYQNMNAGKLGLTLDLGSEDGLAVALDLVRWADVVAESFSPRAMRAWGLGYEQLREINPGIVMLSSSLFGQNGPYSDIAGFGTMGAAAAGFNMTTGWADRDPAMVAAYSDYVAPRFTLAAVLAALEHRDRTGEGQYIDFSQAEASIHFLAPAMLDYSINGRDFRRLGNSDAHFAPHAVYPASGDDRWVAVACETDEQWRALAEAIGRTDLGGDASLATAAGRLEAAEALEAAISAWTSEREPIEVERALQAVGVPAHAVQNSSELVVDPQLQHRGHYLRVPHGALGETTVEASRFGLSRTPARTERAGPTFGQDNFEVLSELLGYDADRVAELAAAGILQ
jgi:crotonobetainyl-CoA:carnitine CoA-transferase CaiB-like acyl-CoA transferase